MSSRSPSRPQWKTTALHTAIAALCANGLFIAQAQAMTSCGPTVSVNQGQCIPFGLAETVVNSGVTISEVDGPAVLYTGDLGGESEGSVVGSLTNNGNILSSGLGGDYYYGYSAVAGVQIWGELLGDLTNNGTISGTSVNENGNSYASGILEGGTPAMQGNIVNTGLISASSTATNGSAQALALYIYNSIAPDAVIDNQITGEITATATATDSFSAAAVGVLAQDFQGTLINDGLITATVNNAAASIAGGVYLGFNGGTINNHGTISAVMGGGYGIAAGLYSYYMSDAEVNNFGTISGASADGGEGYSIFNGESEGTSTINNMQGGVLRGRLLIGGDGVVVNNDGLIDLPMVGQAGYVAGDFAQTGNGTLQIMASGDGEDQYSQLYVGGNANIAGKAIVDVQEINTLAVGQTLSSVVSAGFLTGNFAEVEDNSALFNFRSLSTEGDSGHIDFELVKAITVVDAVNANNNPSALGAAGALDTIIDRGTSNSDMQTVIDALGQLETSRQVSDAASQTTPLLAGNTVLAANAVLADMNRVIQSRMDSNRGMSSGDQFYGDSHVWLKPFGSSIDQDDTSDASGYDANTDGLVIGADGTVSESTRIGVAVAYAKADVDGNSNAAPNSADIDMFQLLGYGSHSLDQDMELNFQLGVGQNNTDGKRDILFLNETAKSDYSSHTATAGIGLARTFTLSESTDFIPSVRTDYTWIKDESYNEKGSSANLDVDSQSTEQLILGLDGKLVHELAPGTSVAANLGVGYNTMNDQASINSAFAAEPSTGFTTDGLDPSPWRQRAGLGLTQITGDGTEVSLRYDAEHSDNFLNQTASVKIRWEI